MLRRARARLTRLRTNLASSQKNTKTTAPATTLTRIDPVTCQASTIGWGSDRAPWTAGRTPWTMAAASALFGFFRLGLGSGLLGGRGLLDLGGDAARRDLDDHLVGVAHDRH